MRYTVFKDLWERGYYLSTAAKFGGDYLAYPGDPHRFHSHHVVIVVPWEEVLSPLEVVSLGRLGKNQPSHACKAYSLSLPNTHIPRTRPTHTHPTHAPNTHTSHARAQNTHIPRMHPTPKTTTTKA